MSVLTMLPPPPAPKSQPQNLAGLVTQSAPETTKNIEEGSYISYETS